MTNPDQSSPSVSQEAKQMVKFAKGIFNEFEGEHRLAVQIDMLVAAKVDSATQALTERLKTATDILEAVVDDLEGYEDGAPDASPLSKTVNHMLPNIRAFLAK